MTLAAELRALAPAPDRRWIAAGAVALVAGGIIAALAGLALGAVPIVAGIWLTGLVDRRLVLLLTLLLLPTLSAFHPLLLTEVGGSPLDFRLLLTGGVAAALGSWLVVDRPAPLERIGLALGAALALAVVLVALNDVAPLRSLPVLVRSLDYLLAFLAARRWLPGLGGTLLVGAAVVASLAVPAASGAVEWVATGGTNMAGATRITGVYLTSPVGLALAMQVGALLVAASPVFRRSSPVTARWLIAGAAFLAFALVLVQSSTRLVFVSFVGGLVLLELLHRRIRAIPVVFAFAALMLVANPELTGRLVATGSPVDPTGPLPTLPPGIPGEPGDAPSGGDASLRFRVFLWSVMLDEWQESPLLGRGTGSFATLFEQRSGLERIAPHNDYLWVLVENGVAGLLAFVAVQALVVWTLLARAWRAGAGIARDVLVGVIVVFVTTNVVNVINNAAFYLDLQVATWSLVGAATTIVTAGRTGRREADPPE